MRKGQLRLSRLADALLRRTRHFVGPDQYRGQFAVAKLVAKLLNEKGKIAVLEGVPGNMSSQLRKKVFSLP